MHVDTGEGHLETIHDEWERFVGEPTRRAGLPVPKLIVVQSPYRLVLAPIINYVLEAERENPDQQIAVLIPELVEHRLPSELTA